MEVIQFAGEIWKGQAVHPLLWDLLLQKDRLIELRYGQPPYPVVLGVPHHVAPGDDRIAEKWTNPRTGRLGRPGDESTGLTGLAVFSAMVQRGIACKLVIAAHPTENDPNKTPGSLYWKHVFSEPLPGMLLELHGAAERRRYALELSAGRNERTNPLIFGKRLAYYLNGDWLLAVQKRVGSREARLFKNGQQTGGRLQNPALETLSLSYAGRLRIQALHLEMKSLFRQPDPAKTDAVYPSVPAWRLARALAEIFHSADDPDRIRIFADGPSPPAGVILVRPTLEYQDSFLEAVREAGAQEIEENPDLCHPGPETARDFIRAARLVNYDRLPNGPPEEWLWLVDQGEFIGRVFIRHWLDEIQAVDGQVDYWVRPSRRGQGYGRLILKLTLERFRQIGLARILISCRPDNAPSRKIIESSGGVLVDEVEDIRDPHPGTRRRYWIDL